jgi:hypothetical protein
VVDTELCASGSGIEVDCAGAESQLACLPEGGGGGVRSRHLYNQSRFVDPINGNDSAIGEGADIQAPLRTLTQALALIPTSGPLTPSFTVRYVIWLHPGGTPDEALPLEWRSWVSLFGFGGHTSTVTTTTIHYLPLAFESAIVEFQNIETVGFGFVIDTEVATDVDVYIRDSTVRISYTGLLSAYGSTQFNDLYLESCIVNFITIAGGYVHAFNGNWFPHGLQLNNGFSTALEIVGGRVEKNIFMHGDATLITRGVEMTSNISVTSVGGNTPVWDTDSSSMTFRSPLDLAFRPAPHITGPLIIVQQDERFVTVLSSSTGTFYVTLETMVLVDATVRNVTIVLPSPSPSTTRLSTKGRAVLVKKIDASTHNVTVLSPPTNNLDNTHQLTLQSQYQYVAATSNGARWYIVDQGRGVPL